MQIGFSQRIQVDWLERTANLLLAGHSREQIEEELFDLLRDQLSVGGTAERGNREKAISILLKTWVTVPNELQPLRNEGLENLKLLPLQDHLALHWGMSMAAYPFFATVAESVGKLLRLQGSVAASQVQRRILEQLGERETVARAARRVLRCFIDWGVLEETKKKGIYQPTPVHPVTDIKLATWLMEATLIARQVDSSAIRNLTQSPSLFPFAMGLVSTGDLKSNIRLEVFRQGLDEDMVRLRY